ncbi:MAG: DNA repair protein RadA [Alphaproteobacteria bacterium]|nr:DNA repair protein RadA [Alphaproteobacteria bacterium]
MSKKEYEYICQNCGSKYGKWAGKCNECGEWNTIEAEKIAQDKFSVSSSDGAVAEFISLKGSISNKPRLESKISELDRVLGGGFVDGSTILIGGDPGIGKSTLLLQVVSALSSDSNPCAYISGEESIDQIRLHATRLDVKNAPVNLLATTNVTDIVKTLESDQTGIKCVVIDSIQTMYIPDIPSAPGTVSQVRASAHELISVAKRKGIIMVIVGHVTKEGQIAGPKILEHMVDTVLYFEGEKGNNYRVLRSVKNRFGNINEIGIFEMSEAGLEEVKNPSSLFISERNASVSGSTIFAGLEGTRPILVEIQALVSRSHMVAPRRAVVGWDLNRLSMMIAVLSSRYGVNLSNYEVYLNVVGGLRILEPAADVAVICSLISAIKNQPLPKDMIAFGEVGLSGEVRRTSNVDTRLKEAFKLGFKKFIIPAGSKISINTKGFEIEEISHIKQLQSFFVKETT